MTPWGMFLLGLAVGVVCTVLVVAVLACCKMAKRADNYGESEEHR
jgi:hypothetical protein